MSRIDPGEGYRLLEDGEVIEEGDEYQIPDGLWNRSSFRGGTFNNSDYWPHRRKLPVPVPSSEAPIDPGEGYRLIGRYEQPMPGDETLTPEGWKPVFSLNIKKWPNYNDSMVNGVHFRRRVPSFPVEFAQQVADTMADKPAESGWVLTADRKPAEDDTDEREHVWVQSPTGEVSHRHAYFVNEEHCPYWHPKPKAEKPAPYVPPVPEPEPLYEAWVNVYPIDRHAVACPTKEVADRIALPDRIRCVRVREVRDDQPTPDAARKAREVCEGIIAGSPTPNARTVAASDILNILNKKP